MNVQQCLLPYFLVQRVYPYYQAEKGSGCAGSHMENDAFQTNYRIEA